MDGVSVNDVLYEIGAQTSVGFMNQMILFLIARKIYHLPFVSSPHLLFKIRIITITI